MGVTGSACSFPDGLGDGVWSTRRIRGEQGTRWFRLQCAPGAVIGGFSGFRPETRRPAPLVGMTVATDGSRVAPTAVAGDRGAGPVSHYSS